MDDARFEIVTTESGAPALRDRVSGEVMHPGSGPLAEAQALYVAPARLPVRLAEPGPAPLRLLDLGLGAGTNALCALRAAEQTQAGRRLEIVSLDLDDGGLAHALACEQRAHFGFTASLVEAARSLLAGRRHESARASWRLVLGDALTQLPLLPACAFDVVFWDPYSPRTNPELWSEHAFAVVRRLCRDGATLHTYGAATATRSALVLAGFYVGFGPALGKKQRRATIAATRACDLAQPLDHAWLASLARSAGTATNPALSDEALARLARSPQFA